MAEVDLQGGLHDGGGTIDSATVVAGGELPFNGNDDDLSLFGGAGKTVNAGIGNSGCIGIESVFHC